MTRALIVLAAAVAQRASIALCRRAGLWWHQRVELHSGPWCVEPCDHDLHRLVRLRDDGRVDWSLMFAVDRAGRVVVALEWAPDGGGTTLVLNARDELVGAGAETLRAWLEAERERDDREVRASLEREVMP